MKMCTAAAALAALATAASAQGAASSIVGQKRAQSDQIERNRRLAARRQAEAIAEFGELQAERVAARRKAADRNEQTRRDERRARARARAARGEAGVSGLSVRAQERDIAASAARRRESELAGLRERETAVERRKKAIFEDTGFQLANRRRPDAVDFVGGGLNIAESLGRGADDIATALN